MRGDGVGEDLHPKNGGEEFPDSGADALEQVVGHRAFPRFQVYAGSLQGERYGGHAAALLLLRKLFKRLFNPAAVTVWLGKVERCGVTAVGAGLGMCPVLEKSVRQIS